MKRFSLYMFIFILGLSLMFTLSQTYAGDGGKVIDRVCTMQIDKGTAETLTKDGYTYYFCSNYCKTALGNNPAKYACICPKLHEGCDCGHCAGKGEPCRCAEGSAESHTGKHEGGGHKH